MKLTAITSAFLPASMGLAAPSPSKEIVTKAVNNRLATAQHKRADKTPKEEGCPGGKDYNFCVPWFSFFNCMMPGPSAGGIIPQPDPGCQVSSNQMCACWCSCAEDQCDEANLELPEYCKED
ncbi:hypothetical protein CEP54_003743 [Fusarium duplospermum]|uniref:Uncharacterized protein n=1 Tax=Fusarium duplospermum TaxID=1325734 RepID=A0A428QML9_9HYPO|nr:hypothetical protein CEP54_003743 [Fusarium duplospermum]